jgi:hypothetical protein
LAVAENRHALAKQVEEVQQRSFRKPEFQKPDAAPGDFVVKARRKISLDQLPPVRSQQQRRDTGGGK